MREESVSTLAINRYNQIKWFVQQKGLVRDADMKKQLSALDSQMNNFAAAAKSVENELDKTEAMLRHINSAWDSFLAEMHRFELGQVLDV